MDRLIYHFFFLNFFGKMNVLIDETPNYILKPLIPQLINQNMNREKAKHIHFSIDNVMQFIFSFV